MSARMIVSRRPLAALLHSLTRPMPVARLAALLLAPLLAAAAPRAGAQAAPARPKLSASADTNSWEAYYDYAVKELRTRPARAEAAFYWASQLAPRRAEPLFGRWVAFWLQDYKRWKGYLDRRPSVTSLPEVALADGLRDAALRRNPFVHQGLAILLYDQMPGSWREDNVTHGWIAYAQTNFPLAIQELGRALKQEKKGRAWIRTTRAQCFVNVAQYDSAAAELEALRSELTAREARTVETSYESKEMIAYALAMLRIAGGDRAGGRAALADALTENFAFYPAHDLLGQLALADGDTAVALREAEQAVQIAPDDVVMEYHYGVVLLAAQRPADAVAPLLRAVAAAPWYAAAHYSLAVALRSAGEREGARTAFARYVAIAPRSDSSYVGVARRELARLADPAPVR